ncbi:MAG TPA: CcmD family protein [Terriglobales bacterium]|nr:CcmD family protein [Terriglobales bacterium]
MNYLYLAYGATWTIHIVYLVVLTSRAARLKKEVDELKKP